MYNEDVSIDFSANVAPFSASLSQAVKNLENMSASADTTLAKISKLDNVMLKAVTTFGKFLDLNKASTQQAAAYQQKLAGLATVTALNEKQFKGLTDVTLKFSREFPVGLDKSIGLVNTLRTSGVTTTKSIKELGKAFIEVQAATGEWSSGLVSDILSVNRSFGGTTSSAIKFGDSLVTVTNKFGASASAVVGFTKNLAPVASAMGLNATQTMGFATAFSRLGEDGLRSANALNKVMSDLTVSAKTGSPQIATYAAAMNMSADSLKTLVDTDPAEAVIKFTEAISKQGPRAIDTLNRLGIDGVQTFKAIQTLGKSTDLRDILQTGSNAFGSKSAFQGAKEAFGGVNDQMTRLGETMNQTVAAAGTPFLNMISGLLKGANAFAEAIHSAVQGVSTMANKIAPLIAIVKALHSAFTAMMLLQFGRFLGNAITNNTNIGRSFMAGRADASYNITQPGGNFMYRAGTIFQNNMSGLTGTPLKESLGNVWQAAKGVAGYGAAGIANLNASMLRSDPSEPVNRQLATRTAMTNFARAREGLAPLNAQQIQLREEMNERRMAAGMKPIGTTTGQTVSMSEQAKSMGAVFKQFGSDMKSSGASLNLLAKTTGAAGAELRTALVNLTGATLRAGAELTVFAVKTMASVVGQMAGAMLPMLAIMAAFSAFNSIKEGTKKAHDLRDQGLENGLKNPGSVYNDFAQKAGLATRNVDALAQASLAAAHQLVMNTKTMNEANTLTQQRLAAAQNPAYQQAWTYQKNKNPQELANEIINLEGANPNPQARAQLLNDLVKQYGAGTAQQVVNILAPSSRDRSRNIERNRTSSDVYAAGLADIEGKRENRWWSPAARFDDWLSNTINHNHQDYKKLHDAKADPWQLHGWFNNPSENTGHGHYDTEASRDAMSSLITNISQQTMTYSDIYGSKAGQLAKVSEAAKLMLVAKNQGREGDAAAVINSLFGTDFYGSDVANAKDLKSLFKNLAKYGTNDEKTLYKEIFGKGGYAIGQNLLDPNFMKVFTETQDRIAQNKADAEDKKADSRSKGLASVMFAAQDAAKRVGVTIEEFSADSTSAKGRKAYLNAGKKGGISIDEKIAIDAYNRPNDPVAQGLMANNIAIKAMNNHSQDYIAATKELTSALRLKAEGTTAESQTVAALQQVKNIQDIMDVGLSEMTKSVRDVKIGQEAQKGPMPTKASDAQVYNDKMEAMKKGYQTEIQFVKQFAQASAELQIQIERQNKQYQKSVMRSNRDFNTQLRQQDEDYRLSVYRANRDFQLQRTRQGEDFAKSVYAPFQRIAAVRTTDASSLLGNLKQQNKVIKEQMKNVAKLKKMGLSQQSIDTLDLFNPSNAQEVARLVLDFATNKSLIEATNQEVSTRNKLSYEHETSTLNQKAVRDMHDFNTRMSDSEINYKKSITRAVRQHKIALNDMEIDLRDSQLNAYRDLAHFGFEIDVTGKSIKQVLSDAFSGMPAAAKSSMSTTLSTLQDQINNWQTPTIALSTDVNAPRISDFSAKTGKPTIAPDFNILQWNGLASAGNWYQDPEYKGYYWKLGEGNKFDQNMGAQTLYEIRHNHLRGSHKHIYDYDSQDGYAPHKDPKKKSNSTNSTTYMADGGLILGPGTKTSDSIPAMLSHGEYVVKADAVEKYGVGFLENINAQKYKDGGRVTPKDNGPIPSWFDGSGDPLGKNELKALIAKAGFTGRGAMMAWAIAMAESAGRPWLLNDTPSTGDLSYGLFQINMIGNLGPERRRKYHLKSNRDLYNPEINARIAYDISQGGTKWYDWGSYSLDHHYLNYLNYKNGNKDKAKVLAELDPVHPVLKQGKPKPHHWWDNFIPHFSHGGMVGGNPIHAIKADAVHRNGMHLLDGINKMNFKAGNYINGHEAKVSSMQGYSTSIAHHTSNQYDQSTQINGPITVQTNDPNQFMRQMQAKKRLARLTQPVGN